MKKLWANRIAAFTLVFTMGASFFACAVPTMTEEPVATEIEVLSTEAPMPSFTAEPTPTPEPTPVPIDGERYAALTEDASSFIRMSGSSFLLYESPDLHAPYEKHSLRGVVACGEMLLEEAVTAEDGTEFYRVSALYAPLSGYVRKDKTEPSLMVPSEADTYALLARNGCALHRDADVESARLAFEGYRVARILGTFGAFSFVRTELGSEGFVLTSKLQPLTVSEVEDYLREVENENRFSLEAFVTAVCAETEGDDLTEPIYAALQQQGLTFQKGYYELFSKPLWDETLYPQRHYVDDVYNSRLYRLWNTAGNHVFYEEEPTQWLYVADASELERGDLVFLARYAETDEALVEGREVVKRGRYSGYVTDVGIALGNDTVRIAVDGKMQDVERFSASPLAAFFDCGRRIGLAVTDREAYLRECMISAMYDRLGTPYDKIDRTTDTSYDCSSFVYNMLSELGVSEQPNSDLPISESTAAKISQWETLYLNDTPLHFDRLSDELKHMEDIDALERGDLVFLLGYQRARVGHVMVMVGDNTVIHSTNIDEEYRCTLVAQFREELKKDYYLARRMRLGD